VLRVELRWKFDISVTYWKLLLDGIYGAVKAIKKVETNDDEPYLHIPIFLVAPIIASSYKQRIIPLTLWASGQCKKLGEVRARMKRDVTASPHKLSLVLPHLHMLCIHEGGADWTPWRRV